MSNIFCYFVNGESSSNAEWQNRKREESLSVVCESDEPSSNVECKKSERNDSGCQRSLRSNPVRLLTWTEDGITGYSGATVLHLSIINDSNKDSTECELTRSEVGTVSCSRLCVICHSLAVKGNLQSTATDPSQPSYQVKFPECRFEAQLQIRHSLAVKRNVANTDLSQPSCQVKFLECRFEAQLQIRHSLAVKRNVQSIDVKHNCNMSV
ncbi:hypothetical protein J6590_059217 [Homalodisca vitripennis]|nr:hypothetical protein J6590_059217 [Homalodisca vitripennis]